MVVVRLAVDDVTDCAVCAACCQFAVCGWVANFCVVFLVSVACCDSLMELIIGNVGPRMVVSYRR